MADDDRRLVYSTDGSLPLPSPTRGRSKAPPRSPKGPPDDGIVRVGCEKRRGGWVTLVYGLPSNELETLAATLKKRCGAGGTAKDGIITIQGDKRDTILEYFAAAKRPAKRMGG